MIRAFFIQQVLAISAKIDIILHVTVLCAKPNVFFLLHYGYLLLILEIGYLVLAFFFSFFSKQIQWLKNFVEAIAYLIVLYP